MHGFLSPMFDASAFLAEFPETIVRLRRELGEATFDEQRRKGAAMAQHEVADYALDQIGNTLASLGVTDAKSTQTSLQK